MLTILKERDEHNEDEDEEEEDEEEEEEEESSEVTGLCTKCGLEQHPGKLLLCDSKKCPHAYHTYCLEPKLDKIPRGKWYLCYCFSLVDVLLLRYCPKCAKERKEAGDDEKEKKSSRKKSSDQEEEEDEADSKSRKSRASEEESDEAGQRKLPKRGAKKETSSKQKAPAKVSSRSFNR